MQADTAIKVTTFALANDNMEHSTIIITLLVIKVHSHNMQCIMLQCSASSVTGP